MYYQYILVDDHLNTSFLCQEVLQYSMKIRISFLGYKLVARQNLYAPMRQDLRLMGMAWMAAAALRALQTA
tara:strand:+ start:1521 stop:1733 length:213 start_codon:yes stop_codon:yes gene_type:complete